MDLFGFHSNITCKPRRRAPAHELKTPTLHAPAGGWSRFSAVGERVPSSRGHRRSSDAAGFWQQRGSWWGGERRIRVDHSLLLQRLRGTDTHVRTATGSGTIPHHTHTHTLPTHFLQHQLTQSVLVVEEKGKTGAGLQTVSLNMPLCLSFYH